METSLKSFNNEQVEGGGGGGGGGGIQIKIESIT